MENHVKRFCLTALLFLLVVIFGLSMGVVAEDEAPYCLSETIRIMSQSDDSFTMCDGKVRWDRETQTLTLDHVSIQTSEAVAIVLPNGAHLRVVGDCVIRCTDSGPTAKGIICASDIREAVLYVDGPGHLSVEMAGGYGLFMQYGSVVFDGVSVEVYSPRCGIYAAEMKVFSSSNGSTVRISGKSGAGGTGLYVGSYGLHVNAACGSVIMEGNAGKTGLSVKGDADICLGAKATVAFYGANDGISEAPAGGVGLSVGGLRMTAAVDAVLTMSGRNVSGTGIKLGSFVWNGEETNAQILIEEAGSDGTYLALEQIFGAEAYDIEESGQGLHKITRREAGHTEHVWDAGKIVTEPTCVTAGERVFMCVECSAEKKEAIPALGHAFGDKFVTDEIGHAKMCTRDGCGFKSDYEPHSGGNATCTEAAVCEVCSVRYGETLGHKFGTSYVCDENGHALVCTRDNCGYKSDYESHSGGNATCTKQATCEICGSSYGDVLGHKFGNRYACDENGHALVCTRDNCGYESDYEPHQGGEATCTEAVICEVCSVRYGEALGHKFGTSYVCDENGHAVICTRDDCNFKSEYEPHSGGNATCTKQATCEVCGSSYGGTLGHKFGNRYVCDENGHALVCTRDGCNFKSEYEPHSGGNATCTKQATCEICGTRYGDALGHKFGNRYVCDENGHALVCTRDDCNFKSDYEPHSGGNATCTKQAICEICGSSYGDALGHKFGTVYVCDENGHALVCTRDNCGFKSDYEPHSGGKATCTEVPICEICGTSYGDALGHKFGNRYVCDENGHALVCTRDNCGFKSDYEPHSGGNATCTQQATCEVCGSSYGDALGHKFGNRYVCDENGHALVCTRDDCNFKSDYEPHSGGNAMCTKQATCEICGARYGDALGHKFGNRYVCDENGHALVCTHDDCNFKSDYEPHSGGNATCTKQATCEICGSSYGDALGHKFGNRYVCDGNGHALVCTRYDCNFKSDYEPHYGGEATCTEKATCEVCGVRYGKALGHWMGAEWKYDAGRHWKSCLRIGCGYTNPVEKHDFVSGVCICGAKGAILPGKTPEQSWQIFFDASPQYMDVEEDVREELETKELPSEMIEQMVKSLGASRVEGLGENLDADLILQTANREKELYNWLLRQKNNQVTVSLLAFLDLIDVKRGSDADLTAVTIDISPILCFDAEGETMEVDIGAQEVFAPVKVVLDLSFLQSCPDRLVHVHDDGTKSILTRDDENGFVYDEATQTAVFYVTSFSTFVVEYDAAPTEEEHRHRMGKAFAYNSDCHWRICQCGVISYKGPHRFEPMVEWSEESGKVTAMICSICGYRE